MSSRKRTEIFGLFVVGSLVMGLSPILVLSEFALKTGEQSYILLVPFVSAALIYYSRDRILKPSVPSAGAFALSSLKVVFPGALLLIASYFLVRGSEIQLATTALGLIFFWVGSFHACFGSKAARAAMFELGMLLWIIPIPASTIETITIALQRGSAELVDWLFALCRVPVYRDGFIFSLPGQSIEVAKQCSGIRSTLSLLFLTLILAHESLHSNWRRLILVLSALPIVVLKNGVRIVTLTLLAIYVNPSFLSGSLHHDGGIVFFLLGLVILMPIIALLRKGDKSADTPSKAMAEAAVGD